MLNGSRLNEDRRHNGMQRRALRPASDGERWAPKNLIPEVQGRELEQGSQ
jgi:hypothetical protein